MIARGYMSLSRAFRPFPLVGARRMRTEQGGGGRGRPRMRFDEGRARSARARWPVGDGEVRGWGRGAGGRATPLAGGAQRGGGGRDARRERSRSPAHERSPARARACTRKRGVGVGGAVAARAGFSWRARRAPLPGWGKGLGGEPRQRWMDPRGARRPRRQRVQQAQSLTRLGALVGARCWARPTAP